MERNVAGSSPLPQDASLSAAASPFPFAEPSLGVVYKVHNDAEFDQLAAWCVAQRRILVIDYTAAWCGPCRRIAPEFEALCLKSHANTPEADETRNLFVFAKVDVDVCPLTAGRNNVQAMPTFQVWFDGAKRRDLTGANVAALRQMLLQSHRDYATGQWNGGSVRSNSGGGGGGSSTSAAAAVVVDVPTLTVRGGSVGRV